MNASELKPGRALEKAIQDCTGGIVIVPSSLQDAINKALDKAFAVVPEDERYCLDEERTFFYQDMVAFYSEYGYVPEISLVRRGPPPPKEFPLTFEVCNPKVDGDSES